MQPDLSRPQRTPRASKTGEPAPKSQRTWTILLVLIVAACAWGVWKKSHPTEPANEAAQATQTAASKPKRTANAASQAEVTANEVSQSPALASAVPKAVPQRTIPNPEPAVPKPEPSPYNRQLVTALTQIDLKSGALTPEQAAQWKQGLQAVILQGAASVPAIREFLDRKQDLNFAGVTDGNLMGYPSLRAGLLDALQQIGGPEALQVSLDTLRTTADPLEIALLARNLEQQAPGQYRQDALNAAQSALALAAQDKLDGRDVAPLFQLFQAYGDPTLLSQLQSSSPRWGYYATLALAGLPDGQGIPTLIREIQDTSGGGGTRSLSLQLLAQAAGQYPDAANALIDQARLNQIPDSTWRQIGWMLGGDDYQFGNQFINTNLPAASGPGVRTFHIESGNQNYYTTSVLPNLTPDQINQRRAFIDQLLAVATSPIAIQGLQAARASLSAVQAQR